MKALKTGLKILVKGTVAVGLFGFGVIAGFSAIGKSLKDRHSYGSYLIYSRAKDDLDAIDRGEKKKTSNLEYGEILALILALIPYYD